MVRSKHRSRFPIRVISFDTEEDKQEKPDTSKMDKYELRALRLGEDEDALEHLETALRILNGKCDRCDHMMCMGCAYGPGEAVGFIEEAISQLEMVIHQRMFF
jgi:hypothetical protein